MEVKARVHDVSYDENGKQRVTFTLDRRSDIGDLRDKDIRLKAVRWTEKRSLNANGYFHVLKDKIAQATCQSSTEVHNHLISEYGQLEIINDQLVPVIIRDDMDWRRLEGIHVRPTGHRKTLDDGKMYQVCLVMRGSHTYDTKEMAHLIDGTISEAKELGIDTVTPAEKERMLRLWKAS